MRDLKRDLEMTFESYRKGEFSDSDVDFVIVQLMTPENIDEIVAAYPEALRETFTEWLTDPSFGEHPFLTNRGTFDIPEIAVRAARDWARRNAR